MRKIESKQEKEKKRKRKSWIIGGILIFIMLGSTFGYALWGGGNEKTGGDIKELKWVSSDEIEDYFTTSFDPKLKEYINNLK